MFVSMYGDSDTMTTTLMTRTTTTVVTTTSTTESTSSIVAKTSLYFAACSLVTRGVDAFLLLVTCSAGDVIADTGFSCGLPTLGMRACDLRPHIASSLSPPVDLLRMATIVAQSEKWTSVVVFHDETYCKYS